MPGWKGFDCVRVLIEHGMRKKIQLLVGATIAPRAIKVNMETAEIWK